MLGFCQAWKSHLLIVSETRACTYFKCMCRIAIARTDYSINYFGRVEYYHQHKICTFRPVQRKTKATLSQHGHWLTSGFQLVLSQKSYKNCMIKTFLRDERSFYKNIKKNWLKLPIQYWQNGPMIFSRPMKTFAPNHLTNL